MVEDRTNCLVVACDVWESLIPQWLLDEIAWERELLAFKAAMRDLKPHEKVGDAETLAYVMTLSQVAPLAFGWFRIYAYLARKVMKGYKPDKPMPELPDDLQLAELGAIEKQELQKLKTEIFEVRGDIKHPLYSLKIWRELEALD